MAKSIEELLAATMRQVDELRERANEDAGWHAGILHLLLVNEARYWYGRMERMPQAAHLDHPARCRVAARAAVMRTVAAFAHKKINQEMSQPAFQEEMFERMRKRLEDEFGPMPEPDVEGLLN